jgi:hypothetical protein
VASEDTKPETSAKEIKSSEGIKEAPTLEGTKRVNKKSVINLLLKRITISQKGKRSCWPAQSADRNLNSKPRQKI